jgi:hypothetical protein
MMLIHIYQEISHVISSILMDPHIFFLLHIHLYPNHHHHVLVIHICFLIFKPYVRIVASVIDKLILYAIFNRFIVIEV